MLLYGTHPLCFLVMLCVALLYCLNYLLWASWFRKHLSGHLVPNLTSNMPNYQSYSITDFQLITVFHGSISVKDNTDSTVKHHNCCQLYDYCYIMNLIKCHTVIITMGLLLQYYGNKIHRIYIKIYDCHWGTLFFMHILWSYGTLRQSKAFS